MKTPFLALFALALVGCGPTAEKTPATSTTTVGGTSGGGSAATPQEQALAAYLEKVPADLKHDAFEYYGLGNGKPTKLEIVREAGGPESATRTVQPGKVENGKATFILHQEGALSSEGDITLSLESDGVYAMSSSINKLKAHSLEMPSKLEVGGGWKDHTEMTQAAQNIVLDNDLKIVAKERVSTPGGTFDEALHVTSTGKGTFGDQPVTLNTQHWYVRGVGPVKQIVEVRFKDGRKQKVTVQLADPKRVEPSSLPATDLSTLGGSSR